ncbi:MAG TPA: hypothetical protein VMB82_13105, partial [Acidimicrobiales bacterium]|nr:hypothetical protein [Acidimicrobiales bacterium]
MTGPGPTDDGPGGVERSGGMAVSRRRLLAGAGALGIGALAVPAVVGSPGAVAGATDVVGSKEAVLFYGEHQAGIVTPQQEHLVFAAYDLPAADRR